MRDFLMRDFHRVESHQIRIAWVINGTSGHGEWFDWSKKIEDSLQAHVQENHKPATGQSMSIEIRTFVEMREKEG